MTPESLKAARLRIRPEALRYRVDPRAKKNWRLKKKNRMRAVSIEALAEELEISRISLGRMERGVVKIPRIMGFAIAAILNGLPPVE